MTRVTLSKKKEIIKEIKQIVRLEGCSSRQSACSSIMFAASSFGETKEKDLVNAGVAAELFYQALHSHYWKDGGLEADVIFGDYYGSIAIIHASKLKDVRVIEIFCQAIQDATRSKNNDYRAAGRLAKIYAASAYIGAYLAGLDGGVLGDFYDLGEKTGLKILKAIDLENWKTAVKSLENGQEFILNLEAD